MTSRPRIRIAAATIAVIATNGCGLTHPYPTKSFFVLPGAQLGQTNDAQAITIEIPRAAVAPPFNSRAFQFRVAESRYEPAYYDQWSADPGMLFTAAVSQSLASTQSFVVLPEGLASQAPVLRLHVIEMYADVRASDIPTAVIALQATLWSDSGEMLLVHDDRAELLAQGNSAADLVTAWGEAAAQLTSTLIPHLRESIAQADKQTSQ